MKSFFFAAVFAAFALSASAQDAQVVSLKDVQGISQQVCKATSIRLSARFKAISDDAQEIVIENPSTDVNLRITADRAEKFMNRPLPFAVADKDVNGNTMSGAPFFGIVRVANFKLNHLNGKAYDKAAVTEKVTYWYECLKQDGAERVARGQRYEKQIAARGGKFVDLQIMGHEKLPPEEGWVQIISQELIVDRRTVATLWLVRTPAEIRWLGYELPAEAPTQVASAN